jgi:hypothetical protein
VAPAYAPQPSPYQAPPAGYAQPAPQGPSPFAPAAPVQPSYGAGALVLVHWADGNRYPATVLQSAGNQVLVVFPSGQQQWVELQYVSTGA